MKRMIMLFTVLAFAGLAYSQTPTLVLNEFMASSDLCCDDGNGEMEDFVELYNYGDADVDIAGLWFTDTPADTAGVYDAWQIPSGFPETVIPAGGFIAVWFDKESEQGPLHVESKLSSDGEFIIVLDTDGATELINYEFGPQYTDVSYGQFPDGSDAWDFTVSPTPGSANVYTEMILGCMDPEATNYDETANVDDGSCDYTPVDDIPVLFINEFIASNETGIVDTSGEYADWIEIYNPGDEDVDLGGLFITDDILDLTSYQIPDTASEFTTVSAGGFIILWADKDSEEGPLHVEIKLSSGGDDIAIVAADGVTIIDSYTFGEQTTDISEGRAFDSGHLWGNFNTPTPGTSNGQLYINEIMASNETTVTDDSLDYDDWVEIFNTSELDINLAGMGFADNHAEAHFVPSGFSETVVPAGGYTLVWFDNESEEGPLHIEEKLGSGGDAVFLYDTTGVRVIDFYEFGEQTTDISEGRYPDGSGNWGFMNPTPGTSNGDFLSIIDSETVPTSFALHPAYPNPFNPATTIRFDVPESADMSVTVYNILGEKVETLVNEHLTNGQYNVVWNANNQPSGIYFVRLVGNATTQVQKLLLVK